MKRDTFGGGSGGIEPPRRRRAVSALNVAGAIAGMIAVGFIIAVAYIIVAAFAALHGIVVLLVIMFEALARFPWQVV